MIDGQAVAKKLCGQITKATNATKQLIRQYEQGISVTSGSKHPPKVNLQEALDVSSSLWAALDGSTLFGGVPYSIKRQIIEYTHMIARCSEEELLMKQEMRRVVSFFEQKLEVLKAWSAQLVKNIDSSNSEKRGLLALALSKLDQIEMFSLHLKNLFTQAVEGVKQEGDEGIFVDLEEGGEDNETIESLTVEDAGYDDDVEDGDIFHDLLSVFNNEYGSDDDTDSSDCNDE